MTFESLRLAEPIVRAVAAQGYDAPTPIQARAIPQVLRGRDVLGCARTGTGKTAAFALPILHRLSDGGRAKRSRDGAAPRALVLCPTRELAAQIGDGFAAYGANLAVRTTVIFGGVNQNPQARALRAGIDVLVATPGRLLDLADQGLAKLDAIEVLVLDEADHMLDLGFIHDIRRIVKRLPQKRQTLFFSATMPAEIRGLADAILHDPVEVAADPVASPVETIDQALYHVAREQKPALLRHLLDRAGNHRTLVFTRTKHGADRVVRHLGRAGVHAVAIHGNKSQNARLRALDGFRSEVPPVLVATDIAARGIDVDDVTHVFNYDLPHVPETYVHRIGRTARAGASGHAISFCSPEERDCLQAIEKLIQRRIAVRTDVPKLELVAATVAAPTRATPAPARGEGRAKRGGGGAKPGGTPSTKRGGTPRASSGRDGRSGGATPADGGRSGSTSAPPREARGGSRRSAPATPRTPPTATAAAHGHATGLPAARVGIQQRGRAPARGRRR